MRAGRGRVSDPLAPGRDGDGGLGAGGEVRGRRGPRGGRRSRGPHPWPCQERAGAGPRVSDGAACELGLEGLLTFGSRKVERVELSSCPSG